MSKAKLVITAVIIEGRTQAEVAATYGVSKGWVSKLIARYNTEGESAFEPRSRRPKTSPNALDPATVELILQLRRTLFEAGLDAGPDTIAWHLEHAHKIVVSRSTISRHSANSS
jgi:transposase